MTQAERIYAFLSQRRHQWMCDDCIGEGCAISQRQQANAITGAFALTRDFEKVPGTCSRCDGEKLVTRMLHHV
jgi:hypothetical protein